MNVSIMIYLMMIGKYCVLVLVMENIIRTIVERIKTILHLNQ